MKKKIILVHNKETKKYRIVNNPLNCTLLWTVEKAFSILIELFCILKIRR